MASEFEKWETGEVAQECVFAGGENAGEFICEARTPELAAKIVREHNEREQMVEALQTIVSDVNRSDYKLRLNAFKKARAALTLATPQRGKDGE